MLGSLRGAATGVAKHIYTLANRPWREALTRQGDALLRSVGFNRDVESRIPRLAGTPIGNARQNALGASRPIKRSLQNVPNGHVEGCARSVACATKSERRLPRLKRIRSMLLSRTMVRRFRT